MEEVNEDVNGESSFEFVNNKGEDSVGTVQSSNTPASVTSSIQGLLINPDTTTQPSTSTNTNLKSNSPTPPQQSFLPPLGLSTSPASFPSTVLPPQPIPMFPVVPENSTTVVSGVGVSQPLVSSEGQGSSERSYYIPQTSPIPNPGTVPVQMMLQPVQSVPMQSAQSATISLPLDNTAQSPQPQVDQSQGSGVWGWLKSHELLNKVAEKAKNSVDSMITTLDPGMKEYIYSGGDIDIIVASDKEVKVSPIREAFQHVFGRANVKGIAAQAQTIASQPIGFSAGVKGAEERINFLHQQGLVQPFQIVVAVENFLTELTPDSWYDIGCLILQDMKSGITLQTFTQATPVPQQYLLQAQDRTPPDYPLGWSGCAVTIGHIIGPALGVPHTEWQAALTGVSRREILFMAAKGLAGLYKARLQR